MSTTERYPDSTGLTFEKVWAMFQETDKNFQKQIRESQERIEKSLARTHREIGFIGNRMGSYIEHLVAAGAKNVLMILNFILTKQTCAKKSSIKIPEEP